jgi:hypothetical protein
MLKELSHFLKMQVDGHRNPNVRIYGDPNFWSQGPTDDRDQTRAKHGISHKIKWDGKCETFHDYERDIHSFCRQNGLGYLIIPHFMAIYLRYGTRVFEKAPHLVETLALTEN